MGIWTDPGTGDTVMFGGHMDARRPLETEGPYGAFETSLSSLVGEQMRSSRMFAELVWGGLTNLSWTHPDHGHIFYSFRGAGDLVASIVGEGDYMTFYCSAPSGKAPVEMVRWMAVHSWEPAPL